MSESRLPELLRALHAELEHAKSLDPESRELLRVLAHDLARFEEQTSSTRDLAVRFEAEHPALAAALRQIADTLAKAGI
jgi:hypothetical protein